jgi:predicted flavoprotein YhiN
VIGAGPAGFFCAIPAAAADTRVILLEKMSSPARKLLLIGLGQCNITHDGDIRNFLCPQRHSGLKREKKMAEYTGDVLLARNGLSGPGILDISRTIRAGDVIQLSVVGKMSYEDFAKDLVLQ